MANQISVHQDQKLIYNIITEQTFKPLLGALEELGVQNKKLCIVTDSTVAGFYLTEVKERLTMIAREVVYFIFPAGEENKNLNIVNDLYEVLIQNQFDRSDMLIALGGGVVGDLAGFAAATYLRGVDFIQIPTTLLSQVDSSIGGKTGVDFNQYKNMVGAFHQPKMVYINISTLKTLTDAEFFSGMGEIIKHGLIKDATYYRWLIQNQTAISHRDLDICEEMIIGSCQIKRHVVEYDPKEHGERALLNFGHTIGHAVEKLKKFTLLHGECVSIGVVAASYISWRRKHLSTSEFEEIISVLRAFSLPVNTNKLLSKDILHTMKLDKKMEAGIIKFILLDSIGNAVIDRTVTQEELEAAANYIIV